MAKYAEFDKAISNVKAATQETAENMGLLREAALDAGAETAFSATEAAGAIEELGKAGLSTQQILDGGLNGALSLAAAGQLDVAEAAQATAIALKQFGLDGGDASHVADLLAAGAGKAVGDVDDLSQALNQAGLVANGAGFSIEETTGVLAAFADAGLLGSDAGTSLKTAIIALQSPSAAATRELEKYKISVYDSNGQMRSFSEIAGQLESKLGNLTDQERNAALATIFGNDALRSANVLYTQGADGIQRYIDQTNDSGFAAKVAADRLNNLAGDVEKLGGLIDTTLIRSGSGANNVLRELTQTATFLVDSIGSLPAPVLESGLALTAVGGSIALVGGGALIAVPKVVAFKASLDTLGISGRRAALGLGTLTLGLTAAVSAVAFFVGQRAEIEGFGQSVEDSLDPATGALTDFSRELVVAQLKQEGAFGDAKQLGISQKELTDAVLQGGDAYEQLMDKVSGFNTIANAGIGGKAYNAGNLSQVLRDTREGLDLANEGFRDTKAAADGATDATEGTAGGLEEVATSAQVAQTNLDDLKAAIEGFGSAQLDANSAAREFEAAVDGLTESIATNGQTLDVGTAAGRANQAALDQIASSTLALSSATLTQTGSQEAASAAIATGRQRLIEALGQLGITGQAAEDYADKLGLIPSNVTTVAAISGVENAIEQAERLRGRILSIPERRTVTIDEVIRQTGAARGEVAAAYPGRATGGPIYGPGTGTSDSILIRASNNEHMWTAREVDAVGGHAAMLEMRREVLRMRGYATGGPIVRSAPQYVPAHASGGAVTVGATQLSLKGATINATMDGIPLQMVIQDQIISADRTASKTVNAGRMADY